MATSKEKAEKYKDREYLDRKDVSDIMRDRYMDPKKRASRYDFDDGELSEEVGSEKGEGRFYQEKWFIVLSLILFFPLGVFLLWNSDDFDQESKMAILILTVFYVAALITLGFKTAENFRVRSMGEELYKENRALESKVEYLEGIISRTRTEFTEYKILMEPFEEELKNKSGQ